MDRPRTIERIVAEVAGEDYAAHFWQEFRQPLCAQGDIARMAELGYNSVRIPINARLFLEESRATGWTKALSFWITALPGVKPMAFMPLSICTARRADRRQQH